MGCRDGPASWTLRTSTPTGSRARALELLERRGGDARRLTFVVDEAGQYVARSVQRMLDLQGLAEAFQKQRGDACGWS